MALQAEISGEYFNMHYIHVKNVHKYHLLQYKYCIGDSVDFFYKFLLSVLNRKEPELEPEPQFVISAPAPGGN
jgi:hypothetical protein